MSAFHCMSHSLGTCQKPTGNQSTEKHEINHWKIISYSKFNNRPNFILSILTIWLIFVFGNTEL